ncbi:MAG TPA: HD domain-containing phosphohydrolase [Planctomycetaceae bacterium]|jgi:putative two-component system response regulator|nr:HD domain-containing phosphohydrolase [Planctomycetaceae bacterium]
MQDIATPSIQHAPPAILVVDDEFQIRELLSRWLTTRGFRVVSAESAATALRYLESEPVDLVTLDIAMPHVSGIELLRQIRQVYPDTAVLMLTGLQTTAKAIEALTAGAYGYLIKPVRAKEFLAQVEHGLEWHRFQVERRQYTELLEQRIREQTQTIQWAHEETIHRLVAAAASRDLETGEHLVRTGLYSEILARAAGWSPAETERIRLAAPMHDIGKIGLPDAILRKQGGLTPDERSVMQRHTITGAALLAGSNSPVLCMAREIAMCHHEHWDGSGYPHGLVAAAIPEAARILAIADVYDALIHDRIYRRALVEQDVLRIMSAENGRQFDPTLMTDFFTVLDEFRDVSEKHPDVCQPESALHELVGAGDRSGS